MSGHLPDEDVFTPNKEIILMEEIMANWKYKVKIRHLLTEKENYDSIKKSMAAIADILEKESSFANFGWLKRFRKIPKGNDILGSVDYGNKLLDRMYDYADEHQIWIE